MYLKESRLITFGHLEISNENEKRSITEIIGLAQKNTRALQNYSQALFHEFSQSQQYISSITPYFINTYIYAGI
jgi:hypothetical protein